MFYEYYNDYQGLTQAVFKWWVCPKCGQEFLFRFNGHPTWPPLDLECPLCEKTSTIPWRVPPLLQWTCSKCGYCQPVGRCSWSRKVFQVVSFSGYYEPDYNWAKLERLGPECAVCGDMPFGYDGKGPKVTSLGSIVLDVLGVPLDGICAALDALSGTSDDTRKSDCIRQLKQAEESFNRFLKTIPSLVAERNRKIAEEDRRQKEAKEQERRIREQLRREMKSISGLKRMKPVNFELAIASLYLALGYEVYVTPTTGDRGIDLVAKKGKMKIAFQCKRYRKVVPENMIREFYGSFTGNFKKGIFVTSSTYSSAAKDWAKNREGLELMDGKELAKLMVKHNPKFVSGLKSWLYCP